ncbi:isochorismatase family protein [Singulisphaera sp. PoT]|uniref:isochorismatase family protein n=1 Tax=Singulisphaera sp. PoT TaxID=3411797 RepID=UPI003BF4B40E
MRFRMGWRGLVLPLALACNPSAKAGEPSSDPGSRTYENKLTPLSSPRPILADFPEFVEPIRETARFAAPTLVDDPGADLEVRAWRFSYNARGIIEMPNRLRADRTAVIVVHPWGIDDGQGWKTPEPAGVAFQCTPAKNKIVLDHGGKVINPLLKSLRGRVGLVAYSLPGKEDPIRKKVYRSFHGKPTEAERREGAKELSAKLKEFPYEGKALPSTIVVSPETPTVGYFQAFPGLDAGPGYDHAGFWDQPIPVMNTIDVHPDDYVIYDLEGYPLLRDELKKRGIRHVLLTGYNTDMCVCLTTAGYKNLGPDFDVFLVGDATIATFPAHPTPRFATTASVSFAALNLLVTQASWIHPIPSTEKANGR